MLKNKKVNLKKTYLAVILGLFSLSSFADEAVVSDSIMDAITNGKNMTSFRLRYEDMSQDGAPSDAHAFTLRSLAGWQTAPFHSLSVGAQLIGVTDFNDGFNTKQWGVNSPGKTAADAFIQDPNYYNINQLYVDWTAIPDTKIRAGQQSLKIDNVRFIGNVEFRQVMQVFNGVTVENKSIPNTDLYAGYYTRLRKATTSQELSQDTGILHATYHLSPTENLIGYGYWYDSNNDKSKVTGSPDLYLSSRTIGIRADGSHKIDDHWKLLYTAEYAKQDRIANGDSKIDAHYYKLGLGAAWDGWFARVDQELLSSNNGLYAFQTPLGTNHLFQGWVDKFAASTPVNGIQDTYLTVGGKWQDFTLLTEYHWFNSDKDFSTGSLYGKEWDVSVAYAYNKQATAKLEYGTFSEGDQYKVTTTSRYRNTDKLWLTANYNF